MQITLFKDPLKKLHAQIFTVEQKTACVFLLCLANLISWLLLKAFPSSYSFAGYAKYCAASECLPACFKTSTEQGCRLVYNAALALLFTYPVSDI